MTLSIVLLIAQLGIIVIQLRFSLYLIRKDDRITQAGHALYEATFWTSTEPHKLSAHQEDILWQSLRDALQIAPGAGSQFGSW